MESVSSPTLKKLQGYVAFVSWFAIAVGLAGLAGAIFHIQLLRTILPGLVAIKANTAVCVALLGLSLWLQRYESPSLSVWKRFARGLTVIVALIGSLSLLEWVFGWDFRIDQLLHTETAEASVGSVRPGLMSPITALNFILLGVALAFLDWTTKRKVWPSQILCLTAGFISLATLVDFILKPHAFHAHIALQTVTTLCIFSLAPLCARPNRALSFLMDSQTASVWARLAAPAEENWLRYWPLRFGVAIVSVVAATLVRHLSGGLIPEHLIYITFYPAVTLSAMLGGLWPGVLSTVLSAASIDYYFLEPRAGFGTKSTPDLMGLLLFTVVGISISLLAGNLERTRKRAADSLRKQTALLQAEMESNLRAKKEWELTFNTVSDPVMLLDTQQHILRANRATTELLGLDSSQVVGRHCYEIIHKAHCPPASCPVQRMLKTGVEERGDVEEPRLSKTFDVVATPIKNAEGALHGCVHVIRDITERKQTEQQLQRVNRTLQALSVCTDALMRARDESTMLKQVCDAVVQVGGYRMSWVGYAEHDENKTVRPMAWAGAEDGYLNNAKISWADVERGRGPTGTAIRTGKLVVCRDTMSDTDFAPWRAEAIKRGYRSSIVLPLQTESGVFGALNIYAPEVNAFDTQEQRLLEELANNVSYALATLRAHAERKRSQEQLRQASLYTRSLIEASLDPLVTISKNGTIMDVNRATEQATGVGREALIGSDFCNYFLEPERAREGYQQVFSAGFVHDYPLAIRNASGAVTDVLYNASVFRNGAGEVEGVFAAARDVTERKKVERKLREQAALLDLAHDAILLRGFDGQILFWSRGATDLYGWSAEEALGKVSHNLLRTEFPVALEVLQTSIQERREWEGELKHICRDGRTIVVASRWSLLRDEQGNATAIMEINRDVTGRKQAEEKLRSASLYTRSLIEASLDPLVTISREGKITDVNAATEKATGVLRAHLIGTDFSDYFTDPEKARHGYQQVFAEGVVHDYPLAIRSTSGSVMDVLYNATLFKNEAGDVQGIFAAARDVTARKKAEAEVREASLYTRSLIEASLDPLVTISREGKITDVNQATERVTGVVRERLIGSDFSNYFTEPDQARRGYQEVFSVGFVHDYPLAIRHVSGEITDVLYNAALFKNEAGEVQGVFAAARDVTARNRAEAAVREAALYTRSLIEASLDPLVTISREGKITDVNQATERITGISREQLIGSDFSNYFTEPEKARRGYKQVFAEETVLDYPLAIQDTSGRVRDVLYNASIFKDESGKIKGVFAAARDVTRMKEAEREVRQLNSELEQRVIKRTAELETANKELEAFTYSVSHDLRAPLRHISGFSKILSEEFGPSLPEEAQHHLGRIQEGTRRMGALVDDLLNLARVGRQELRLQVTGLNSLVDEVIAGLKPECEDRQVEWKRGSLPFVECDPGLMKQVFQNLLSNALKFTRPRTPAVIEIGVAETEDAPVIFVRDNGVGFSMKYADKLFGVFQRLHRLEDFEGTGVGLATVQRIVHKHGGRIWAEAELDRGATFYVTLTVPQTMEPKAELAGAGGTL